MDSHSSIYPMISIFFDVVLLLVGFWMALTVAKLRLGGAISNTITRIVTGSIILGLAHLAETVLHKFGVSTDLNEVIHRLLILIGFAWLALGIQSLVNTFGNMKK